MPFRIAYSDITKTEADAIVNPTDRYFSGGGGVDKQIHDICGPALKEATDKLSDLHLGEVKAMNCCSEYTTSITGSPL